MLFRESLGFGTPSARPGSTTATPARGHAPIGSVIHTYPTFTAWRPAYRLTVDRHRSRVCSLMGLLLLGSVTLIGCRDKATDQKATSTTAANQHTVRILVVDDAPLAQAIVRQWSANLDQPIRMLELPRAKLDSVQHLAADIVVYPAQALGTLAERNLIQPLQPETLNAPQLALRDVLELERHAEVQWGDQVLAVSFGSPQLVLFYRKDIFDRLKLLPPHTWTEYQTVAERLTRESIGELAPPQEQAWTATIEPLAGQWAAKLLLARAAAYARHPSQFSTLFEYSTMEPLIDGPPFVRALEELVAASKLGPDSNKRLTPVEAKRQFLAGHAAMAFAWPSRAAASVDAASDASADSASVRPQTAPQRSVSPRCRVRWKSTISASSHGRHGRETNRCQFRCWPLPDDSAASPKRRNILTRPVRPWLGSLGKNGVRWSLPPARPRPFTENHISKNRLFGPTRRCQPKPHATMPRLLSQRSRNPIT